MPFYLKDHALAWYNAQSSETKGDLAQLTIALETRSMALMDWTVIWPYYKCYNYQMSHAITFLQGYLD